MCVCVFLMMKILPWSSLVFFCCCSCILPTSDLTRIINSVNSLKELLHVSENNTPKKLQIGKILKNASFKSFSHIFWLFFTCALFCSSSLFLLLFLFKNASFGIVVVLLDTLVSFVVFWQLNRWYRDICSLISSGGSSFFFGCHLGSKT